MVLRFTSVIILWLGSSFLFSFAYGHGDLHERIVAITKEIKNNPDDAQLFMKRGELYFQHEDYPKSKKDFQKSEELGLDEIRLVYNFAKVEDKLQEHESSLQYLDEVIARDDRFVKAYRLRGNILFETARYKEAAMAFEKVLVIAKTSLPENYIEASVAWQHTQTQEGFEKGIEVVQKGIVEKGNLITFYNQLEAVYRDANMLDSVIDIQTQILDQASRKETSYYKRGLTYLQLKKFEMAKADFKSARDAILQLNTRLRSRKAIKDLYRDIQLELEKLN